MLKSRNKIKSLRKIRAKRILRTTKGNIKLCILKSRIGNTDEQDAKIKKKKEKETREVPCRYED